MFCTHRKHPLLPQGVLRTRLTSVGMSIGRHLFCYQCLPVLEMLVEVQRLVINGCMCQIGTARSLLSRRVLPSRRAVPHSLTALFAQRLHRKAVLEPSLKTRLVVFNTRKLRKIEMSGDKRSTENMDKETGQENHQGSSSSK